MEVTAAPCRMGAVTVHLSSGQPRWHPASEDDLARAAAIGLLEETHYLDLKRELKSGTGANKELARDLAQFAIDGGTLLIGVAEHQDAPPSLAPVDLDGLSERIEQIARAVPDPPLPVRTSTLASRVDPARGYVLVHVPVSGTAPHMVDGVYYGRGDKTRIRLSDAEVVRLHQTRAGTDDVTHQLLDAYVARDPVPLELRRQAHLFVVAAPLAPRPEMALGLIHEPNNHSRLYDLVNRSHHQPGTPDLFAPEVRQADSLQHRSDGVALAYGLTAERALQGDRVFNTEDALEIEFTEEGTVRLLTTRLSDTLTSGEEVLFEGVPVVLVRRTLSTAAAVAEHTGYAGPWALGVHADKLAGLRAHMRGNAFDDDRRLPVDMMVYRQTATASTDELVQTPGAVTKRLVGRYLRALGLQNAPSYAPWLSDQAEQ